MAETKTRPTNASIDEYLASRASPGQLADCKALMAMCKRVTMPGFSRHSLPGRSRTSNVAIPPPATP